MRPFSYRPPVHARHKIDEARFFLNKLATATTQLKEFQYYVSAFVTAWRSVTFVLQKSYAGNAEFARWYADRIASIRAMEHAKALLDLRNIVQKEGTLPVFELRLVSHDSDVVKAQVDSFGELQVKNLRFEPRPSHRVIDVGGAEGDALEALVLERIIAATTASVDSFAKGVAAITTRVVIDEVGTAMTFEDFMNLGLRHLDALQAVVDEAVTKFGLPMEK